MNSTIYHHTDVQINPRLPTPGIKNIAEEFDTSANQIDHAYGVKPVDAKQGIYRIGVTGAGANQIKAGHAAKRADISPDFYVG